MTENLIRSASDWLPLWRARMKDLGLSHRDLDHDARLGEGYFSKIAAGMKEPGAATIAKINAALLIALQPVVDVTPYRALLRDVDEAMLPAVSGDDEHPDQPAKAGAAA